MSSPWAAAVSIEEGGLTLVRIRGVVDTYISAVTAVNDSFIGAHGICIVSADANTAGAYPDPLTEDSYDGWIWHSFFTTYVPSTDAASRQHSRIVIDNKAMRKLQESDVLVGLTEVAEVNDGSTLAVMALSRTLFLES